MRHPPMFHVWGWRAFTLAVIILIPQRVSAQSTDRQCPNPTLAFPDSAYANRFQKIFYTTPGGRSAIEVRVEEDAPADQPLHFYTVGSGHIIRRDSTSYYILTALHVVEPFLWGTMDFGQELVDQKKKFLVVSFVDGRPAVHAEVVNHDERHDIALLKAPIDRGYPLLDPVPFGNSQDVRIGDELMVIGNPAGMAFSVMIVGVAGLDRDVVQRDIGRSGTYLQTVPAAPRGMSGGLAIDRCGNAVGMVQLRVMPNPDRETYATGLLKPIDDIKRVLAEFRSGTPVPRGSIPVLVIASRRLSPTKRAQFGIPDSTDGLAIMSVVERSQAQIAGLRAGDVILSVGPFRTRTVTDLTRALRFEFKLGQTFDAIILRKGKELRLQLTTE